MAKWLQKTPVLYGIWHPYKQVVNLVDRTFFPILSKLEASQRAVESQQVDRGEKRRYI